MSWINILIQLENRALFKSDIISIFLFCWPFLEKFSVVGQVKPEKAGEQILHVKVLNYIHTGVKIWTIDI